MYVGSIAQIQYKQWRWWSRCISMVIAKTASRNVAFKMARMRESIMEDQDEIMIRRSVGRRYCM